jgi:crotonobetainyl-CoA:carnitine CoA-transferase CaiB-like acyl-CoA transferase
MALNAEFAPQTFVEYEHPTEGLVKTPGFPYKFSQTPAQVFNGAPQVGEHTLEVLSGIGFTEQEIADLLQSKNVVALELL